MLKCRGNVGRREWEWWSSGWSWTCPLKVSSIRRYREWKDSFSVYCDRNGEKYRGWLGWLPHSRWLWRSCWRSALSFLMETHSVSAGNSIAGTCISANLRRKKCENTKIPRAEVFPVLLFIIGLLSCFLQILFLFICHLSTSFYQERVNIQFYIVKPIRYFLGS